MTSIFKSIRLWLLLLSCLGLMACTGELDSQKVQRLQKIQLSSANGDSLPSIEGATATEVALPMRWREEDKGGLAKWFVMSVNLASTDEQAIYIPRVSSRVELWINKTYAARWGQRGDADFEQGKHPVFHSLDKLYLTAGKNDIWLRVEGGAAQTKGLSDVYVGHYKDIKDLYFQRWWREVGFVIAIVAACCILGLFGLWFGLRIKTQYFISFGLASFGWALQSLPVLFSSGGSSNVLLFMLAELGFGVFVSQIQIFAIEQMKISQRFLLLNAKFLFLMSLVLAPTAYLMPNYTGKILDLYHGILLLSALMTMPFIVVRAFKVQSTANWILMLASVTGIAFGTYDLLNIQLSATGFSKLSLTRFSALIFLLAMLAIVLEKQIRSVQLEKHLNQELMAKVGEREMELKEVYQRESKYKEDEIKRFEAEKIASHLHEGMSTKLNALQFMMQDPKFDANTGNKLVKEAIEQLKVTTSAMSSGKRDLASVVGYQLYKLHDALDAAQIKVEFQADELPAHMDLTPSQATHLGFLVQGLIENVVKHSQASRLLVSLHYKVDQQPERILVIEDNGMGFDASAVTQGLVITNLKRNAVRLGAQISLKTKPQGMGTKVTIEWNAQAA